MSEQSVVRWTPVPGLSERPATIFNLGWDGFETRLVVTVFFASNRGEVEKGSTVEMTFNDVLAFRVADDFMDESSAVEGDIARLDPSYPYGGVWPFLEVLNSAWTDSLAEQDCAWEARDLRHWVVATREMHLHVATPMLVEPTCSAGRPAERLAD